MREKIFQIFVNNLQIVPIWRILFLFLFARIGIHELFLFLFVQKLARRIYSYSYLREKFIFADHWRGNPYLTSHTHPGPRILRILWVQPISTWSVRNLKMPPPRKFNIVQPPWGMCPWDARSSSKVSSRLPAVSRVSVKTVSITSTCDNLRSRQKIQRLAYLNKSI